MCGRYVSPEDAEIERYYRIDRRNANPFRRRYNVAPATLVPIIRFDEDGRSVLSLARWGFIPEWWKRAAPPARSFNARSEEAASKPMWRNSFRRGHCLIPALGWYEWQTSETVDTTSGEVRTVKQPHYIFSPAFPVFAFAGLVAARHGSGGEPVLSCAVLTKSAAACIAAVHDRMPVVLGPDDAEAWLSPSDNAGVIAGLIDGAQSDFHAYPVSRLVNNARNDSPDLIERV